MQADGLTAEGERAPRRPKEPQESPRCAPDGPYLRRGPRENSNRYFEPSAPKGPRDHQRAPRNPQSPMRPRRAPTRPPREFPRDPGVRRGNINEEEGEEGGGQGGVRTEGGFAPGREPESSTTTGTPSIIRMKKTFSVVRLYSVHGSATSSNNVRGNCGHLLACSRAGGCQNRMRRTTGEEGRERGGRKDGGGD